MENTNCFVEFCIYLKKKRVLIEKKWYKKIVIHFLAGSALLHGNFK